MTGVRTALIGCGRMGLRHLQALCEMGWPVVGVCDARADAQQQAREQAALSPDALFDNAATMLGRVRADCVIVATTADSHAKLTCLAAEHGARYILCEKPMAVSLAECDRMVDVCRTRGVRLAVNHPMRFMPVYVESRRIVTSEAFGDLRSIAVVGGNLGLATNGSHYVEMFRYMTGERPAEVTAWLSVEKVPNPRGVQFEDRGGSVRIVTPSGRRMYIEIGPDQGHGLTCIYAGRNGLLTVDEVARTLEYAVREADQRALPTTRYAAPWAGQRRGVAYPVSVLTRPVLEGLVQESDFPTGEDGRQAVQVLVAAHVSNERGHAPVNPNAELPRDRVFPWA